MLEGSPAPATMKSKRRVVNSSRSAVALAEGTLDAGDVVEGVAAAVVLHASVQLVTAADDVMEGAAEEKLSVALARLLADEGVGSKLGEETCALMVRDMGVNREAKEGNAY